MQSNQYNKSSLYIQDEVKSIIIELKKMRKAKGLSQRKIADMICVRSGTISDLENFKYMPRLDLVIKYSDALGYKLELKLK